MSEQNVSSRLSWEKLHDDLSNRVCPCGANLRSWDYQGDRGISGFGKTEAPVDFECARLHTWREWIEVPR